MHEFAPQRHVLDLMIMGGDKCLKFLRKTMVELSLDCRQIVAQTLKWRKLIMLDYDIQRRYIIYLRKRDVRKEIDRNGGGTLSMRKTSLFRKVKMFYLLYGFF